MTYSKPIFKKNRHYRVIQDFQSGPSNFLRGEILRFDRDSYSPYDNSFVYTFYEEMNTEKVWLLLNNDPDDTWKQYFEEID
jgi:hypothetical protein